MARWSTAAEIEMDHPTATSDVLGVWSAIGIVHPRREPVYDRGRMVGALEMYDPLEVEKALAHDAASLLVEVEAV